MACSHAYPDVETIRSFLDKGAYPNWKDLRGRTAFQLMFHHRPSGDRERDRSVTSSPPPKDNFREPPTVTADPYGYHPEGFAPHGVEATHAAQTPQ